MKTKKLREFGLIVGIGIPLIFGILIPIVIGHQIRFWTIFIGIPMIFLGLYFPNMLTPLYKGWFRIGHLLGWINSKILLTLIYILVLQPISILMKLTNYDPLRIKTSNKKSYREKGDPQQVDFKKIF